MFSKQKVKFYILIPTLRETDSKRFKSIIVNVINGGISTSVFGSVVQLTRQAFCRWESLHLALNHRRNGAPLCRLPTTNVAVCTIIIASRSSKMGFADTQ